jgi:hypothetical protein
MPAASCHSSPGIRISSWIEVNEMSVLVEVRWLSAVTAPTGNMPRSRIQASNKVRVRLRASNREDTTLPFLIPPGKSASARETDSSPFPNGNSVSRVAQPAPDGPEGEDSLLYRIGEPVAAVQSALLKALFLRFVRRAC